MWFPSFAQIKERLIAGCQPLLEGLKNAKDTLVNLTLQLKDQVVTQSWQLWENTKPKFNKFIQAFLAIFAAAYTFKMSVQFAPIILSVITVLAAAPLFSFVLPQFLFAPSFLLPTLLGISLFAGYYKYSELVFRAKIDEQVEQHALKLDALQQQIDTLCTEHEQLKTQVAYLPLHDGAKRDPLPSASPPREESPQNSLSSLSAH